MSRAEVLRAQFDVFHAANPHVLEQLIEMTEQAQQRGAVRVGIGALFEVLRWEHLMSTARGEDDFKLNNNYRAYYVREIQTRRPDLAHLFETRRSRADVAVVAYVEDTTTGQLRIAG